MSVSQDMRDVEDANSAFYDAVETADMDMLGSVWLDGPESDGVMCVHPGWPVVRGRTEVLRSFALIMANMPYIQFFLTDVDVRVAGDIAMVGCVENTLTALEDEDDPSAGFAGGRVVATNVFRRTDGIWRMWVHHASPVLTLDPDEDDDSGEDGLALPGSDDPSDRP